MMHRVIRWRRWKATTRPITVAVRQSSLRQPQGGLFVHARSSLANLNSNSQLTQRWMSSAAQTLTQESVVQQLKTLCNGLRNDRREAPPVDESIEQWRACISNLYANLPPLQSTTNEDQAATPFERQSIVEELRRAYESGIAIASKQRQFDLVRGLFEQMHEFQPSGLVPTDTTYQYLIRDVALELLAKAKTSSTEGIQEFLSDSTWERGLLEVIKFEAIGKHYRKTAMERDVFYQQLIEGVEVQLDDYERVVPKEQRTTVPYNEALRVYASNGVPFDKMLQLVVDRSLVVDIETYVALLQGARWTEIPATISQFLQSGFVEKLSSIASKNGASLTPEQQSQYVHQIWVNAMRAVVNSFTDRFFDRTMDVHPGDVAELKKVFVFVEKLLLQAFPKFQFQTINEHEQVYTIRAKAAATCGLKANTMKILDDYVELAPPAASGLLKKDAFLCAMELFTSSQLEILNLSKEQIHARANRKEVSKSRRVAELARMHSRMVQKTLPTSEKKLEQMTANSETTEEELEAQRRLVMGNVKTVKELERRLHKARVLKSYQLQIQKLFEEADESIDAILNKLLDIPGACVEGLEGDIDVSLKLMEQYMTCASRYEQRLRDRRRDVAPQVMRRVFRAIKSLTANENAIKNPDNQQKLNEFFYLAIRTAVLYWRAEEAEKIVRKKKSVMKRKLLDPREYDLLIFLKVANGDLHGAYALLHEMHNAGMPPSQDSIHRIVLGLLHQQFKHPEEQKAANFTSTTTITNALSLEGEESVEDEASFRSEINHVLQSSDKDTIEGELSFNEDLVFEDDSLDGSASSSSSSASLIMGTGAPSDLTDIPTFLQDWYNFYGVKPPGKTVVPVLARLLALKDFHEFKRLLQILETMDGGLTPATTVWLERRLAQMGKSIDDFRITRVA